jgi:hypothetical protein
MPFDDPSSPGRGTRIRAPFRAWRDFLVCLATFSVLPILLKNPRFRKGKCDGGTTNGSAAIANSRMRPFLSDNRFYRISLLESVNWTWGLSLIVMTIAIHAMGVVMSR